MLGELNFVVVFLGGELFLFCLSLIHLFPAELVLLLFGLAKPFLWKVSCILGCLCILLHRSLVAFYMHNIIVCSSQMMVWYFNKKNVYSNTQIDQYN